MKKILLIVLGLAFIGFEGVAQGKKGHGNRDNHGHHKKTPPGHAYGHHKGKEVVVERRDYHGRPTVQYRKPVAHHSSVRVVNERVYVRARPGITYVRSYTVAPRAYVYVNLPYNRYERSRVLSTREIDHIAHEMSRSRYDEDRLDIARSFLGKDLVYAEDVAFLMEHLNYEETKLRLAKFAYNRTVDKHNYEYVYESLDFHASRKNLDHYIHRF